jgi:hypothetical protein
VAFVIFGELIVGLVRVFAASVCVAPKVTRVSETSGKVYVRVVPVVSPDRDNFACLVVSAAF